MIWGIEALPGNLGGVVNSVWYNPVTVEENYSLGVMNQTPSGAVAEAGIYDFKISLTRQENNAVDVRFKMSKGTSYNVEWGIVDQLKPVDQMLKFNVFNIALMRGNSTTTGLRVKDVELDLFTSGPIVVEVEKEDANSLPKEYAIHQNYPNPFNPTTTIRYELPFTSKVTITVYDILGREVTRLVDAVQPANRYSIQWNASTLSSGVYFYRIDAQSVNGSESFTSVKKLILLK